MAVVIAVLIAAPLGCGDDDSTGSGDGSASEASRRPRDRMCDAFRAISDLDDEIQGKLNALLTPVLQAERDGDDARAVAAADEMKREMRGLLDSVLPGLIDAYDQLAEAAPRLANDVATLRAFTVQFTESVVDAATPAEISVVLKDAAQAGGIKAGLATLRLDEVSRADCDIVLAD